MHPKKAFLPVMLVTLLTLSQFSLKSNGQSTAESVEFEDVYIHTDKSIYFPGEDIWFKAYILNDESHLPSSKSKVLFFNIVGSKNELIISEKFPVQYGFSNGNIHIADSIKEGNYRIIAFTENTQVLPPSYWFDSQIKIGYSSLNLMNLSFNQNISKLADSTIEGEINCLSSTGFPIANVELNCKAVTEHNQIKINKLESDTLGKAKINWRIPLKLINNDFTLFIESSYLDRKQDIKINIPSGKKSFRVNFYPEGGSLIQGLKNRVAFKVVDKYDLPIRIKGVLTNQYGTQIQQVETFHEGMGLFTFVPKPNENYFLSLTSPVKIDSLYDLPKALESGYTLSVSQTEQSSMSISINATPDMVGKQVRLALSNGVSFETLFEVAVKKMNRVKVSTAAYPIGISTLTLFSEEKPVAERLVFLNKNKKMQVLIETDKEIYAPRDKVYMLITTLDSDGNPTPANLSLSVSEENKNIDQSDIFSQLLLSSKINGVKGNLSYYLENSDKADSALNLLLMVYGWRKIKLIEEYSKTILSSKNISGIKGHVYIKKNVPADKATVQLINTATWNMVTTETDNQGFFIIPTVDYISIAQNSSLLISASYPDKSRKLTITLDTEINKDLLPGFTFKDSITNIYNLPKIKLVNKEQDSINNLSLTSNELIEEIVVVGEKIKPPLTNDEVREQVFTANKKTDKQLKTNTFTSSSMPTYANSDMSFLEIIRNVAPPFQVRDGKIIFRGVKMIKQSSEIGALVVVDGVPMGTDISTLSSLINPLDIKEVKVFTSPAAGLKYSRPSMGVIEITLLNGRNDTPQTYQKTEKKDLSVIRGYSIVREFNAPDYTPSVNNNFTDTDIRSTIYWNPNIIIDSQGKQRLTFFVGDKKTKFICRTIGVNDSGLMGSTKQTIRVK